MFSLRRVAPRSSGKIYGTTYYGGENGIGAVYEFLPGAVGEWDGRVIYSFQTGSDGNSPISNLVRDAAGNLYGTTSEGGLGSGTIFKLTPIGGGQWMRVLFILRGPARSWLFIQRMVGDRFGNFYGATVHGGTDDDGCVYNSCLDAAQSEIHPVLVESRKISVCNLV